MRAELNDMNHMTVLRYLWRSPNGDIETTYANKGSVTEIRYHPPIGDGDKHFVDVYMDDGTVYRDFDIYSIIFDLKVERNKPNEN